MPDNRKIIIADDHPLFRAALRQTLAAEGYNILEAEDIHTLQELVEAHSDVQLVLLDLSMPGAHGFSGLVFLLSHYPQVPVLVISANDSADVITRAMHHGACGFLSKTSAPETIRRAIDTVLAGDLWAPTGLSSQAGPDRAESDFARQIASLTPKQYQVLNMVTEGLLNKQIAYELDVTEATVKAHLTEIFRKLGVTSRTQAALVFSRLALPDGARTN